MNYSSYMTKQHSRNLVISKTPNTMKSTLRLAQSSLLTAFIPKGTQTCCATPPPRPLLKPTCCWCTNDFLCFFMAVVKKETCVRLMCRNAARHASRHSISRHEGALKWRTYVHTHVRNHTREHAKTVVHTSDLTSPSWHVNFYSPLLAPPLGTSFVSHGCKGITAGQGKCLDLNYTL